MVRAGVGLAAIATTTGTASHHASHSPTIVRRAVAIATGAIGKVADYVRFMAYDYSTSSPGPIAPIEWVRTIVKAAKRPLIVAGGG